MTFLVAWRLGLLVLVGAFAGAWLAILRQRRRNIVRFTDVALIDVVAPEGPSWRRHVPPLVWLFALTLLIVGFARPARDVDIARPSSAVVIAIDVSFSMGADDVPPTRLESAKAAAVDFVENLPGTHDIGLVVYSGTTATYPPTNDHEQIIGHINNAQLAVRTAMGDAIFESVGLLEAHLASAEDEDEDEDDIDDTGPPPARIVVLGDGDNTIGRGNDVAIAAARTAGIPVDTIAFGTPQGRFTDPDGVSHAVPVEEDDLREISTATGGQFYEAETMDELVGAYEAIGASYATETEQRDISGWFIGAGILFLAVAGGLSLLWAQRLP